MLARVNAGIRVSEMERDSLWHGFGAYGLCEDTKWLSTKICRITACAEAKTLGRRADSSR
jgi:hypothetical protein